MSIYFQQSWVIDHRTFTMWLTRNIFSTLAMLLTNMVPSWSPTRPAGIQTVGCQILHTECRRSSLPQCLEQCYHNLDEQQETKSSFITFTFYNGCSVQDACQFLILVTFHRLFCSSIILNDTGCWSHLQNKESLLSNLKPHQLLCCESSRGANHWLGFPSFL